MNIPNITEARAIKLFTTEYGDDILSRYDKFREEVEELHEVFNEYQDTRSTEAQKHLLDELSDVQGTFTHLASLMGLYQKEMLLNCIDKVKGKKIDPNYKRFLVMNEGIDLNVAMDVPLVRSIINETNSNYGNKQ